MTTLIPYCEGCIHEGHFGPNCINCCFGSKYVSKSVYMNEIRMDKVPEFNINIDMAKFIDDLLVIGGADMKLPKIKDVIFNKPATIIIWADGSKTVVKCGEGDAYDPEKGLAMAIVKKAYDNKGNYNDIFKKWISKDKKETFEKVKGFYNKIDAAVNPPIKYYTVKTIADMEGISEKAVRNKIHNGEYPGAFKQSGCWLIPVKQ